MLLLNSTVYIFIVTVPPDVITPPENQTTTELSSIMFTCVATANPRAAIQWIRNKKVLRSNESSNTGAKLIITKGIQGNCEKNDPPSNCLSLSKLWIYNTEVSDSGEYTCKAINEVGESLKNATLAING